ncbi:IS1/IS1595 family N-terminal zinc-binding domain-containing protein [Thermodesulforhabdus norvegica]|nr:helix-turn-helix domain-containing protein [Thermodesulforhabdus norvegica]
MGRRKVFREDMRCPHCGSNWCIKNGRANGKQTYLCRHCNYRFTPEAKRHVHPRWLKEKAIGMYLEGMSISSISRALGISLVTVYSWIKKSPMGFKGLQA